MFKVIAFALSLGVCNAFAGGATVFVVPPDDSFGLISVAVDSSVVAKVDVALKKGDAPLIQTEIGPVVIKGRTSANELIGVKVRAKEEEVE